jgi:DNA invertase Pin-like site-specific DNA recombinase
MFMLIGYARVSTLDQTLNLQLDALKAAGCAEHCIYTDTTSGKTTTRPGLEQALRYLRPGDMLVVWRLDRLGRSLKHLIETVAFLHDHGIGLRSLTEQLDTTTPAGKLIFHVFGALAEFERDLIRERTYAGLAAARARGRRGGRPRKLTPQQVAIVAKMHADPSIPITEILNTFHISKATLYKHLAADRPYEVLPIVKTTKRQV